MCSLTAARVTPQVMNTELQDYAIDNDKSAIGCTELRRRLRRSLFLAFPMGRVGQPLGCLRLHKTVLSMKRSMCGGHANCAYNTFELHRLDGGDMSSCNGHLVFTLRPGEPRSWLSGRLCYR